MWVTTLDGFYSCRNVSQTSTRLQVRARVRSDLERLLERLDWPDAPPAIIETLDSDYRYRVILALGEWRQYLRLATDDALAYENFKSAVVKRQGHDRADAYLDVWEALLRLQRINEVELNHE